MNSLERDASEVQVVWVPPARKEWESNAFLRTCLFVFSSVDLQMCIRDSTCNLERTSVISAHPRETYDMSTHTIPRLVL